MRNIRRQSIISALIIYIGFAVGLLNTYFFTKENGNFTAEQYGLTSMFMAIATLMMAFSSMAMPSFIFKFYHYYADHLPVRKNDMLTWSLVVSSIGFLLVMATGWIFKDIVIRKFGEHSSLLLTYYYWIFPMGFGLTIYTILESYAWSIGKPVVTSFLKEVEWRLLTTVLIVLFALRIIPDFDLFIKLYAFTFPGIALTLFLYLWFTKKIAFTFSVSKVTRRYFKKIAALCVFFYSGQLIFTISQVFDSIVIAALLDDGLSKAGIFGVAQIMTSVIQAPQRSIIASSITHLSRAWKDKNKEMLQTIYQRASINLLLFAIGIFSLVALNYREAVITFHLKDVYLLGFTAFIFLGLTKVIDLGCGLSSQIIVTSNYWRFELISGVLLIVLMVPSTYFLTKQYDILGPAIANLFSITIYNTVRIYFLWKKFGLFPFTKKSAYAVGIGGLAFVVCYFLCNSIHGITGMFLRSILFLLLFGGIAYMLKLSPDVQPVINTIKQRIIKKKIN